jgi:uncharacterized protein YndB with AHSA1/START domain
MSAAPQSTGTGVTSLAFELELPHPPTKVWRALTEPTLLAEWLLPVIGLELEPGAAFTFKTQPQPNWDGIVNCRMLEVDAHRRLSYAWGVAGGMDLETIVTFTLTPTASGTHLSLVHSGFKPDQKQNLNGARYGWKMMTGKLVDLLARIP